MRQQDEGSPNGSGTASFYVRNTLDGMSTPTAADPADVAWDLEPLVDGEGDAGVDRLLDEADRRAAAFAEALRRARRRARRPRARRGDRTSSPTSRARRAAPAPTRRCASPPTPPTRPTARCCSASRSAATAIETRLLFFDLEWAALDDERAEELLAADGLDRSATTCARCAATARTCSPSPRRSSSPRSRVTGRDAWSAPVLRADSARSRSTSRRGRARPLERRARARAACPPTARCARERRRGGHRGAAAGPAHARVHLQHAAARQGHRRPPAQLPDLDLEPQPRQRGQRRVRRRRSSRRSRAATTSRSAGTGSRRGCSGIDRLADYDRMASVAGDDEAHRLGRGDARSSSTPSATSPPRSADTAREFFDERWIDAPVRPGKRGGAFCSYTVPSRAPVRDAQLHLARAATC